MKEVELITTSGEHLRVDAKATIEEVYAELQALNPPQDHARFYKDHRVSPYQEKHYLGFLQIGINSVPRYLRVEEILSYYTHPIVYGKTITKIILSDILAGLTNALKNVMKTVKGTTTYIGYSAHLRIRGDIYGYFVCRVHHDAEGNYSYSVKLKSKGTWVRWKIWFSFQFEDILEGIKLIIPKMVKMPILHRYDERLMLDTARHDKRSIEFRCYECKRPVYAKYKGKWYCRTHLKKQKAQETKQGA